MPRSRRRILHAGLLAALAALPVAPAAAQQATQQATRQTARAATRACAADDGGLTLPAGFCARVVADRVGRVRKLSAAPDGTVYAAIAGGADHGILALRDTTGDGIPDQRATFGPARGDDAQVHDGYLYFAMHDRILRWKLGGGLVPAGEPETIARDLPTGGDHDAKSLAFKGDSMFVDFGSATNSCQEANRQRRSAGHQPCTELERRAGIWVFSASRPDQAPATATRYATGLRNAFAIAVDPAGDRLWTAVHGRDQLSENWGFDAQYNADNPAEEFGPVERGSDYGWPYCYWSNAQKAKVQAPEYGGDGKRVGRCGQYAKPAIAFPGHWAPMSLAFYPADGAFGAPYRGGAFVAFHGSWNRAPLPQAGYRIVFVPFRDGRPTGQYSTFAEATSGPTGLRAVGVAVAPDGSLYLSADGNQKIWRVTRAAR